MIRVRWIMIFMLLGIFLGSCTLSPYEGGKKSKDSKKIQKKVLEPKNKAAEKSSVLVSKEIISKATKTPGLIDFSRIGLSDEQVLYLIDQGLFGPDVKELRLNDNPITAKTLKTLVLSDLSSLEILSLTRTSVGDSGLNILASTPLLGQLKHLHLVKSGITSVGIKSLFSGSEPLKLKRIFLGKNNLGDESAEVIAASPVASSLDLLQLDECGLTDRGAKALSKSKQLLDLKVLDVAGNPLSTDGREMLNSSPQLRKCGVMIFE